MKFLLTILTCPGREAALAKTLQSLRESDWKAEPYVYCDPHNFTDRCQSQVNASLDILNYANSQQFDYLLFCEDDVEFTTHFRHNLRNWFSGLLRSVSGRHALHCARRLGGRSRLPNLTVGREATLDVKVPADGFISFTLAEPGWRPH
jgi:hypothetical protein